MATSAMTMRDMDLYIESKGYIVDRQYDTAKQEYKFIISDGSFKKTYWWKYDRKAGAKKEAADNMLKDFVASKKCLEPFTLVSRGLIGDIEHGYEYIEDLTSMDKMLEYVKRESDCDTVDFEPGSTMGSGVFTLTSGSFYMKHIICVSADMYGCFSRNLKRELDYMIDKFNNSKLKNIYIEEDIKMVKVVANSVYDDPRKKIKDVIFNAPATIVFWSDGTKTVVKAQNNEEYDREKGLAMAITKKFLGNQGNYYETIKKWIK